MIQVFINGGSGTTGLRLRDRLIGRTDVELVEIPDAERKNPDAVQSAMSEADVTFFCLPDAAAREAARLAAKTKTRVIDTSTAHRTDPLWAYGFPELSDKHREAIRSSARTAVPGCHASGFIALISPLRNAGFIPPDYPLAATSLTGYSGGGKSMISEYEAADRGVEYGAPRAYGLTQEHKHLPEMTAQCALPEPPVFYPVVENFYSGMLVSVSLHLKRLTGGMTLEKLHSCLDERYKGSEIVRVMPLGTDGFMAANGLSGRDDMEIYVTGNAERAQLISRFDNLGKGASGAALQCFNIMTGSKETEGLVLGSEL